VSASPTITRAQRWSLSVPLIEEWASSPEFGQYPKASDHRFLLQLEDSDGSTGWGESVAGGSEEQLDQALTRIVGQPVAALRPSFLDLWAPDTLYWQRPDPPSSYAPDPANLQHRLRHPQQSLIEMALSDLLARRAGIPLCQWFGGPWRDRVLVDYWMPRTTPEHARRCVRHGRELGFTGIKLKTTLEDPNVERLEAVLEEAPDWKVTVDANGRFYRLDDALPQIQAMEAVGNVGIYEDPFPRFHLQDFVALRRRVNARVVVHIDPTESLWAVLQSGAAGGLNIDIQDGLFCWRALAATADHANVPIWLGSGLDLGIRTAAELHLAAAAPNCRLPGDQASPWLRESHVLKDDFKIEDGHVLLPTGPGLGVEVDLDAVDRYCTGMTKEE
jgi:L-alanine-DL-glutamate epimerase-like enolase superfamily enzyme